MDAMSAATRRKLRTFLPWLVGLGILAYLLLPYMQPEKRAALRVAFGRAPVQATLLGIAGALVAYLFDTLATWWVLAMAAVRLRFREVAVIRGVTYFLAIVNYSLGQVAMIFVLSRHGVRAARATGIMLFIMGANVLVLLAFASLSIVGGAEAPPFLRTIIYVMAASLPVYFLIIALRPRFLATRPMFEPLFDLGIFGHLKGFLARLPHVTGMILSQWLVMRCFGVAVPFATAALYMPIVFAIAVLPISPQGLGTSQALAIQFFARFAPGDSDAQRAAVLAFSLYILVVWCITQIIIGVLCTRTEFGRIMQKAAAAERPAANEALRG
jgi:hypothetical protein